MIFILIKSIIFKLKNYDRSYMINIFNYVLNTILSINSRETKKDITLVT